MIDSNTLQEIDNLKNKVDTITLELRDAIHSICEKLDYHNSSKFSHNIDRLDEFNDELQEFKPLDNE